MKVELPIDEVRGEVLARLSAPEVPLVLVAPTGSGKSTRLPVWMAEATGGRVLVVEPRRVACRSLAAWVAQGLGEAVGGRVGYRVRFEDRSGPRTQVLFVTPGVAVRMMRDRELRGWTGVVVDEFHERGWEVDLTVALVRERRAAGGGPALALTSATLDVEPLAATLGAAVVRSGGRTFPVDVTWAGGPALPTREHLAERVAEAAGRALAADQGGEVLVFLPGKGEIEACRDALGPLERRLGVELVPVHGSLPAERLARAFTPRSERRRVFLSTNVAETSVTLPGVTTVIDTGLVRMRVHRAGRSALALRPVSQASMDQRAGRAGRVRPGRCVRLWDERYRPEPAAAPEIERIELDDLVLQAAACGLQGEALVAAPWVTPPPAFALERAATWLGRMGAVDDGGRLTPFGARLAELPVSGDEGRLLVDVPAPLRGTVADLVALLQAGGRLLLHGAGSPPRSDAPAGRGRPPGGGGSAAGARGEEIAEAREELLADAGDEVMASLACLRWGDPVRHGLHTSALAEARRGAAQLRDLLGVQPVDPTKDRAPLPAREALARFLLRRMPDAAFVLRDRAARKPGDLGKPLPWGNGEDEVMIEPWAPPWRPRRTGPAVDAGLVFETAWIGDDRRQRVRGVGRLLLPCQRSWLREEGIGEQVIAEPRVERGREGPRVVATVQTVHAGVVLGSEESELAAGALCLAAARLILAGRLLGDAGERIRDDVHLWNLARQWPEPLAEQPVAAIDDEEAWLAGRLATLGVEVGADLALLGADDVRPDLTGVFAADPDRLAALRVELPRIWEHHGARYLCTVRPRNGEVILVPGNRQATKAPDPDGFHLPRFNRFAVFYKRASRQVRIR